MIRFKEFTLEEILPLIREGAPIQRWGKWRFGVSSKRLLLFKESQECVACGIVGDMFWLERSPGPWTSTNVDGHLNLYARRGKGFRLMTKDHIIPVSKNGSGDLSNLQVMCEHCNHDKADTAVSYGKPGLDKNGNILVVRGF